MHKLKVELGENSYNILIKQGILKGFSGHVEPLVKDRACLLITDDNVEKLYEPAVLESLAKAQVSCVGKFVFPSGEKSKNLNVLKKIYQACIKTRLERSSFIIALGGGVVGDIAGFAAATYMRGISFIQIPTTLLAMVDSSIGGKTGVDLPEGKNLVGAFWQPKLVIIDPDVLKTLPLREVTAGLAEVVKYGVIRDEEFFAYLENNADRILALDPAAYADIIAKCCRIKADVVSEDEKENSVRAILNFGHTFGHALESVSGYEKFLHGEAVAIGMLMASRLAVLSGLIEDKFHSRLKKLCEKLNLPQSAPGLDAGAIIEAMGSDKKVKGGKLSFVLPVRKIGRVSVFSNIDNQLIERAIKEFV